MNRNNKNDKNEKIKRGKGRPKKEELEKVKPNDRIKCKICEEMYTRCNKNRHNKSKIHQKVVQIMNTQRGGGNKDENIILQKKSKQEAYNVIERIGKKYQQ